MANLYLNQNYIVFKGKSTGTVGKNILDEDVEGFGMTMESRKIGLPVKRKTEITIPFRNSTIDISKINGMQTYDDRTLEYKFWKKCTDKRAAYRLQQQLSEWFYSNYDDGYSLGIGEKTILYDYLYCNNYKFATGRAVFRAEGDMEIVVEFGNIVRATMTFKADPYLYDVNISSNTVTKRTKI